MDMDLESRVKGGLYGALVGDALGVPYEFHSAGELPVRQLLEMTPPDSFARAHWRIKPGTWSDDGAHLLCLLASLLQHDALTLTDLGNRLVNWAHHGYLAVDNHVFDIGIQTSRAISNLENGVSPESAGPSGERDNGNGSLMRVLPLALWHRGSDTELVELAHLQSRVTHGHLQAQVCCALYVLVARALLKGVAMDDAWAIGQVGLAHIYRNAPERQATLEMVLAARSKEPKGSGYVVDSLWSARKACRESSYEEAMKSAIALGNDTDTTACIAGGLAGIHFGFDAIPGRWWSTLRGKDIATPLVDQLLNLG